MKARQSEESPEDFYVEDLDFPDYDATDETEDVDNGNNGST